MTKDVAIRIRKDGKIIGTLYQYWAGKTIPMLRDIESMIVNYNRYLSDLTLTDNEFVLRFFEKNDKEFSKSSNLPHIDAETLRILQKECELSDNKNRNVDYGIISIKKSITKFGERPLIVIIDFDKKEIDAKQIIIERIREDFLTEHKISEEEFRRKNVPVTDISFTNIKFNELLDAINVAKNPWGWQKVGRAGKVFQAIF